MQTFGEWLDAELAARGWTGADLSRASQTADNPRGIDSGVISRWRRPPPHNNVPRDAQRLSQLARALAIPESEVYAAAGLLPEDIKRENSTEDAVGPDIRMLMQRYASVVFSYPRSMWATVIEANIKMNEAFKFLAAEPDIPDALSAPGDGPGTNKTQSQVTYKELDETPNTGSRRPGTDITAPQHFAVALLGA
jgi:hypothetical protein